MSDFSEVNWGFGAALKADDLEKRVKALEDRLQILHPSAGCICPPTSEQTCQSIMCPRRKVRP
jgi:hypothetical protein